MDTLDLDHRPLIPGHPLGIGMLGCGWIAQDAHLPGYRAWGLPVTGIYDIDPVARQRAADTFGVHVYADAEELLADPEVEVVDVPARTEDRAPLVRQALRAGKHVLSQKPFANSPAEAEELVALADDLGLRLAVNQNGRWAPSWRLASSWLAAGEIGEVSAIGHDFETSFAWTADRHFNDQAHFVLYDYCAHWLDITRCWLAGKRVVQVRAEDLRAPVQPGPARTPWTVLIGIRCEDGTLATIRGTGAARDDIPPVHRFTITGEGGSIRGQVLDREEVELLRPSGTVRATPAGSWFPDGFAGAMGELQSAILQHREPSNSGRHVLSSVRLGAAAVASAEQGGTPVDLDLEL
ncbi:hypothetical protein GIS00_05335 [Nakamurella sp. YIM 132087]|uniref:Gfo/Idh/MocA family oxidoreductase n=1 Tax=Nakamurella alba TaxID=2665158 RepID=A0A7K1FIU2_9ACTN|nr:Gfo/Idh/MocA family oxidoreductase [Nakamurella alba]MTD13369.1 hypothetical protein [Nakamurella alba]